MAGDWIKMRVNLVTHPKVLAIAESLAENGKYQDWSTMAGFVPSIGGSRDDSLRDYQESLRVTRYVTVCALLRFWGYANEHARDEFISTLRISDIDEIVQVPGFGEALESIGWAEYDDVKRGVSLPNFNEYNTSGNDRSATAKTQAQRQKEYRDRQKSQKCDVTSDVTRDITSNHREEKRREDINTEEKSDNGFASFWSAYPKKTAKPAAAKAFKSAKINGHLPEVLKDIESRSHSDDWTKNKGQFIPNPATYLNQRRWEDGSIESVSSNIFAGAR